MFDVAAAVGSLAYGIASAMIPLLNAEAYMGVVAAASSPPTAWACTAAMGIGTAIGKGVIFVASRRGASRLAANPTPRTPRTRLGHRIHRIGARLLDWLSHPWLGLITVLTAALIGIPPLLAVAVLAGASRMRLPWFCLAVLIGRLVRFAALTWPLVAVTS